MASGGEARLGDFRAVFAERADHVADDLGAVEQSGQRLDAVFDGRDFVVGGFDTGDLVHHRLDPGAIAASGDEGDMQLTQILANQATRVAGRAIDDDRFLVGHNFVSSDCFFAA